MFSTKNPEKRKNFPTNWGNVRKCFLKALPYSPCGVMFQIFPLFALTVLKSFIIQHSFLIRTSKFCSFAGIGKNLNCRQFWNFCIPSDPIVPKYLNWYIKTISIIYQPYIYQTLPIFTSNSPIHFSKTSPYLVIWIWKKPENQDPN